MRRTISLKLELAPSQSQKLRQLQQQFSTACNAVVEYAVKQQTWNAVRLHHICYYRLREQFPDLGSQMICSAIRKVAWAYRALKTKKRATYLFQREGKRAF